MASKTLNAPRRGLSEAEAAIYIGIGITKFRQLVTVGDMPKARSIGSRRVWDIAQLDAAFDSLPTDDAPAVDSWADFRGDNQTQTC